MTDLISEYASYIKRFITPKTDVVVVCNSSNGSTGQIIEKLNGLKLTIILMNGKPDGEFPAHGPDARNDKALEETGGEVIKNRADFGAIFDADGDRVVFVDDQGARLPVDEAAFVLAQGFKAPFVWDVSLGQLVESFKNIRSRVGHFFMKEAMRDRKANFGAEASGHFYFKFDFKGGKAYYDSGLRAFAEMVNRVSDIKEKGGTLSSYLNGLPKYFRSGELDFSSEDHDAVLKEIENAYKERGEVSHLDGLTVKFPSEGWWFNLRPSNTEPLVRLNLESKDQKILKEELANIKEKISSVQKLSN